MKEYLLKLADEYEEDADAAYAYEKWHEAATLYRLALDLREKAAEVQDGEKTEEAPVRVCGSNGEIYKVTRDSCTCMDYTFRGGPCKHMNNLKQGYYGPQGMLRFQVVK